MTIEEIITWCLTKLEEMKGMIAGSFVYFLYGQVFNKRDILRGLASFLIGSIFAVFVSPQIYLWFPTFNYGFISFATGFLGMQIMEALLEVNYKTLLTKKIQQSIGTTEGKD